MPSEFSPITWWMFWFITVAFTLVPVVKNQGKPVVEVPKVLKQSGLLGLIALIPVVLFAIMSQQLTLDVWQGFSAVLGGLILSLLVGNVITQPSVRMGVITFVVSLVLANGWYPIDFAQESYAGLLWGLIVGQWIASLFERENTSGFEVMPAVGLLAGWYWVELTIPTSDLLVMKQVVLWLVATGLLTSVLLDLPSLLGQSLSQLVGWRRWLPLVLTTTISGLFLTVGFGNILLKPMWTVWAWVFALGVLAMGVVTWIEASGSNVESTSPCQKLIQSLSVLAIVAFITLIGTRMVTSVSWLVLLMATLGVMTSQQTRSSGASQWFLFAIMSFFALRLIVSPYLLDSTANITGVNLMHTYTTAATLVALAVVTMLPVILQTWFADERVQTLLLLFMGTLGPMIANIIVHAEPMASFMIIAAMGGLVITLGATWFYRGLAEAQQGQAVLPWILLFASSALVSVELVDVGNHLNRLAQSGWLIATMVLTVLLVMVIRRLGLSGGKPIPVA